MKKSLLTVLFFCITFIFLSSTANASINFSPKSLNCPEASEGEEVTCDALSLRNTNLVLGAKVNSVEIGDTENFTIDASACVGKTLSARSSCSITVKFHPQSGGGGYYTRAKAKYTYIGFVRVNKISGAIYGYAAYPIVRLSTDDIAFGEQTIGSSHRQYVKMENIGNAALDISSISVPYGSGFSVEDDCGDSLAADNYCGILVYFEPTETRDYLSTLELVDNAYDSPQQIDLSGTGIEEDKANINIDKTKINFGEQDLDSETTETITVTSTGTINLTIDSVTPSGAPFTLTETCTAASPIAPDGTCTITAKFTPTTAGSFDGTITLVDGADSSPQTITLSGKGITPNATLIPSMIDFGNQTIDKSSLEKDVILLNSGTATLTITDISLSSTVFTEENTCGETLEPKQECLISITFSPTETGITTGSLSVTSDDPSSPAEVFLSGNGITGPDLDISPPLYDFGNTPVGTTAEQKDFTIMNTGEGDLTISAISVNSDFAESNECPSVLSEEETCTVETTFTPTAAGNYSGTLLIVDNAEGNPHKASLYGYGTISDITIMPLTLNFGYQTIEKPSLAQDITLYNSGNETITINSIESSSSLFVIQSNTCESTLAPSNSCALTVVFTPTETEYVTAKITITDDTSSSPHTVELTGTGIDPVYPDLDVSPNFWDFGQILVGGTSDVKEFTVKNTGTVDATITDVDANSEFAATTSDCIGTLASGETCTISGTFNPQAAGKFTGYIKIVDNTYSGFQTVSLQGTGTHSGDIDISFSATTINFGEIAIYSESDIQTVILTNAGTDDATIGAINLAGSEADDFNFNTNCSNRSLDVGKSCIINIIFEPLSSGSKSANVMVYDDAHDSPQAVALFGTGAYYSSSCSLTSHNTGKSNNFIIATLAILLSSLYFFRRTLKRKG